MDLISNIVSNAEDSRKWKFNSNLYYGICLMYPSLESISSKKLKLLYHVTVFKRTIHQFIEGGKINFFIQRMHDTTGDILYEFYFSIYATKCITCPCYFLNGQIQIWDPGIKCSVRIVIFFSGAQSLLINY